MSEPRVEQPVTQPQPTFTEIMRKAFKGFFEPIAAFLNRIGIFPNTITLLGLVGHFAAGFLVIRGYISWAGLVLLVMAPIDALDGTMARLRGESTRFGAFVDSVTDRYSELVILGSLLLYFIFQNDWLSATGAYLAAAGSILVSYIRSRAESLGYQAKNGILSRMERYFILIPGLIFNIPIIAVWLIAIFSNLTAIQRILYVRRQAYAQSDTLNRKTKEPDKK